jgi:hypothetical protein
MRIFFVAVPALLLTGAAVAQDGRPNPLDLQAKVPPVEFRSAFDGYRPFADQELADWRKANEEVATAGGHAGQRPGHGPREPTSKPQSDKPERSGHGDHK